ncbi:XdhC family protein [Paraburkholderia sp. MPAMCS5]|uniref:XdhC family protein n=1 Tax=Paraburkholderia sp. MPAMCS5 TaxID=3112563 RepID=UPI002E19C933|nr:XdhC family protein [Paraburkholderia sp. MPAMCS5]
MDTLDQEVLHKACEWMAQGHEVMLATVVRTWGSSPRPPGALLALRGDGRAVGSVSGGCIEDDLIDRLRREGMPRGARSLIYGVSAEDARRFGLPCGGTLELVIEPLSPASQVDVLLERIARGELVARELQLSTGAVRLSAARPADDISFDGNTLASIFGPRFRLLLIGAGQLSASLARIAVALDFAVTVCDPREEHSEEWAVPGTVLTRDMPDDVVMGMHPDARMAVIALTHDPKLDDLALMEALKTPAFYVAALGSRRNNDVRRMRLREFDLTDTEISKLRGPAGIYIGSRTPMEIAVSIAAELIAMKNAVPASAWLDVRAAKHALEVEPDALSYCTGP